MHEAVGAGGLRGRQDLSDGGVAKTSPFSAGGVGLIPHQEAEIPGDLRPKNQSIK